MKGIVCPIYKYAQSHPHYDALITSTKNLTYSKLNEAIEQAVFQLKKKKIKAHDRIAIHSPNTVELVVLLFALWRLKAIVCLLNTRNPIATAREQAKFICARFLFTEKELFKLAYGKERDSTSLSYSLAQEATILFTSGSSNKPKAALHTFGNHFYNALGSNENIPVKSTDRWLLSLPLYHVSGIGILMRTFLNRGTVLIPSDKNIGRTIERYFITHVSLVTTQLQELLKKNKEYPSLKAILLGGSPIPQKLIKQSLKYHLPIYISYGLTEAASQVATSKRLKNAQCHARILKYRKVKIIKDEICIKGPVMFKGYLNGNKIEKPFDRQGWFHSGDLGQLQNGILAVHGRRDNMFISGGENIQPEEIERCLSQFPNIQKAAVIPQKDMKFGCRPVAFLQGTYNKKVLIHYLKKRLPSFKIPSKLLPWPKRIRAGIKIDRSYLKALIN
jgi:O-succinylbenzoic acid--CoA ligase